MTRLEQGFATDETGLGLSLHGSNSAPSTSLMGHFRPIDDVCAMSAFAPIATKLLNYSRGRNGQSTDMTG